MGCQNPSRESIASPFMPNSPGDGVFGQHRVMFAPSVTWISFPRPVDPRREGVKPPSSGPMPF